MSYSYLEIRRAVAEKVISGHEFYAEQSEWSIFKKTDSDNEYSLIKIAGKTKDGYKFAFDESQVSDEVIKNIFCQFHKDCNKDNTIKATFYCIAISDNDEFKDFREKEEEQLTVNYFEFSTTNNFKNISKLKHPFNEIKTTGIKIDCKNYVTFYSYPEKYNSGEILFPKVQTINKKLIVNQIRNSLKEEGYPVVDYNRILDRSFIYFLEYGSTQEVPFKELFDNGKYQKVKTFIEENNTKSENFESITRYEQITDNNKNEMTIYDFKKSYITYFKEKILKYEEFKEKFFKSDEFRKCAYCGVPEDKLNLLKTVRAGRGNRLEYDRVKSRDGMDKIGYSLDNIVLSCYWCNNAKTDTFSASEFKEIARGINQAWNQKMRETGSHETICFPENSDIWNRE